MDSFCKVKCCICGCEKNIHIHVPFLFACVVLSMTTDRDHDWSILCCLAERGYFLRECSSFATDNHIPFQDVVHRPYGIRRATTNDISSLLKIEVLCWDPMKMQVSEEVLLDRITSCPQDQWVATQLPSGQVVGVIYTQRISSIDFSREKSFTFSHIPTLRDATGGVLQLVGVAVLPTAKELQLGRALRDFMLLQAQVSVEIMKVVAITRCSSFHQNCPDLPTDESKFVTHRQSYVNYVLSNEDPTVQFHCSAGAKVLATMQHGYRPEDSLNLGSGVLVGYFCSEEDVHPSLTDRNGVDDELRCSETLRHTATMRPSFDMSINPAITLDIIKDLVLQVLGNESSGVVNSKGFENTPFMVLGMDSLQMVDFSRRLAHVTTGDESLPSTFLFDHPTPRGVLAYFMGLSGSTENSESDSPAQEGWEHVEYAVVGMSCRFPGGADSPEKFYQLLCNRFNPLGLLPESWGWVSNEGDGCADNFSSARNKRKIGLLDDISSESFDSNFFGLSKAEVSSMDPHQRLLLTIGYEALLDAEVLEEEDDIDGEKRSVVDSGKQNVGVYVGLCNARWGGIEMQTHTHSLRPEISGAVSAYSGMGSAGATAANRLSFLLNLSGPSIVVDTACSSSLVAVHTACQALKAGDCSSALVAAADLLLCPYDLEVTIYGVCGGKNQVCAIMKLLLFPPGS